MSLDHNKARTGGLVDVGDSVFVLLRLSLSGANFKFVRVLNHSMCRIFFKETLMHSRRFCIYLIMDSD